MAEKIVIIGSGAAGVSAAKTLRARNENITIDIYTEEECVPYFRPSLTFAVAMNPPVPRPISPPEFYQEKRIGMHLNMKAVRLDRTARKVIFADGSEAVYDKLLLATGARCFVPPIPGADLPEVMTLRNARDLQNLMAVLKQPRKVLVIGCGVLGLELAGSLLKLGNEVTMIEAAPTILPRQLDANGGRLYMDGLAKVDKLKIVLGSGVKEITGEGHVSGAVLLDGSKVECDLVMVSAGNRANLELAKDAGLKTDRGIAVNEMMETEDPAIYAAGDCAEIICRNFGLWEPALEQGKVAAGRMLDEPGKFNCGVYGATLNAFGIKLYSIGAIGGDNAFETIDQEKRIYRKIFMAGGKIVGGILLGDTSQMATLSQAINAQLDEQHIREAGLIN